MVDRKGEWQFVRKEENYDGTVSVHYVRKVGGGTESMVIVRGTADPNKEIEEGLRREAERYAAEKATGEKPRENGEEEKGRRADRNDAKTYKGYYIEGTHASRTAEAYD